VVRAVETDYRAPSNVTASNELQALSAITSIVPDTLLLETSVKPKAATVSALVLSWVLSNEQLGMKQFQNAISASLNYDKCLQAEGDARLNCQLDKAMANVGAILASQVEGRICTEVDPRLAKDKDAVVKRVHSLVALYQEMGVPSSKLIFRVPGTWEAIQAAAVLEKEGIATQVFHIYSFVQGAAAAQAGVSVIQPNVGRTRDWYNKNPGVIRDPHGPREDSGFASRVDPGIALAIQLYQYSKKFHPKTQIMASGLRTKEDALALAGIDYEVLSAKIISELESSPTLQGYNSGLSAAAADSEEGLDRVLSPEGAKGSEVAQVDDVTAATFKEELGLAGEQLLAQGLAGMVKDVTSLLPFFASRTSGTE